MRGRILVGGLQAPSGRFSDPGWSRVGPLESTSVVRGPEGPSVLRKGRYVFKVADRPDELAQLHALNWRTFVREVPQHHDPGGDQLVDKFHDKNLYFVALCDGRVVGMLAVHDQPPFSIAEKLDDPKVLAGLGPRPLEVRLLAVEPEHRHSLALGGLGWVMLQHARAQGHSHLLISGFVDRLRMYERMGFRALGPPVRRGGVDFVPMVAHVDRMPERIEADARRIASRLDSDAAGNGHAPARSISLTPGHAANAEDVLAAAARPWIDHRGAEFLAVFEEVRARLTDLAGGPDVALFTGSGTLANDVVAATLASDRRLHRGLVLVNGEFGQRLARQAARAGLSATTLDRAWGQAWDLPAVEEALAGDSRIDWVWGVHLESSTGMLNDVPGLLALAARRGVRVCLDAVSGFGAVPLDLSRVHLASGVANKALGGVAGLSFVCAARGALTGESGRVPACLDLREALATRGPRFTMGSGPLLALQAALLRYADGPARRARFAEYLDLGRCVRSRLLSLGLPPLVGDEHAAPTITTFTLPARADRDALLQAAAAAGFTLGGGSGYLRERGWLQIATMGDVRRADVQRMFAAVGELMAG